MDTEGFTREKLEQAEIVMTRALDDVREALADPLMNDHNNRMFRRLGVTLAFVKIAVTMAKATEQVSAIREQR